MDDIINRGSMYLNKEYVYSYLSNETITPGINLYPEYIIDDDIFSIFEHVFNITKCVHHLKSIVNRSKCPHLEIKLVIIPKSNKLIYNDDTSGKRKIGSISQYLES